MHSKFIIELGSKNVIAFDEKVSDLLRLDAEDPANNRCLDVGVKAVFTDTTRL